jgi:hypothetical protein
LETNNKPNSKSAGSPTEGRVVSKQQENAHISIEGGMSILNKYRFFVLKRIISAVQRVEIVIGYHTKYYEVAGVISLF